ncbi:flap endonuclease GEN homolog 1 [Chanos chanos]|uniref:Flap endonuclease GEN homolog 1 n=1 Tax=Chanos chanos TaxID=29144 RepID=A0A6J2W2I0_CHACN|nr:flap endonuclease GEN homolog 1 [Chanos chanos]
MGVHELWSILGPVRESVPLYSLAGKTLAVDLSLWVCEAQHVQGMMGKVTKPHLRNLFFRVSSLTLMGVRLVFVMEGEAPEIKAETIQRRVAASYGGVKVSGSKARANQSTGRSRFKAVLRECADMLDCLGVPWVTAAGEAEAMCAFLDAHRFVDGCITNDGDAFLYGARTVYRNFNMTTKDPQVDCYRMSRVEAELTLCRETLVGVAILLGCDYMPKGVAGVGKEQTLKLIQSLKGRSLLQKFSEWESADSGLQADAVKKVTHCRVCRHPGSAKAHECGGCVFCGSTRFCLPQDYDSQCPCDWHRGEQLRQACTVEANVRKKTLACNRFPFTEIIHEFLVTKDKPVDTRRRRKPNLLLMQNFALSKMEWPKHYTSEKVLPLITYTEQINRKDARETSSQIQPIRIHKPRVRNGIASFEVVWKKPDHYVFPEDTALDGEDGVRTVEEEALFCLAYPDVVEQFHRQREETEKSKNKKKRPHTRKEKPGDVCDTVSDLLERMTIQPRPATDTAASSTAVSSVSSTAVSSVSSTTVSSASSTTVSSASSTTVSSASSTTVSSVSSRAVSSVSSMAVSSVSSTAVSSVSSTAVSSVSSTTVSSASSSAVSSVSSTTVSSVSSTAVSSVSSMTVSSRHTVHAATKAFVSVTENLLDSPKSDFPSSAVLLGSDSCLMARDSVLDSASSPCTSALKPQNQTNPSVSTLIDQLHLSNIDWESSSFTSSPQVGVLSKKADSRSVKRAEEKNVSSGPSDDLRSVSGRAEKLQTAESVLECPLWERISIRHAVKSTGHFEPCADDVTKLSDQLKLPRAAQCADTSPLVTVCAKAEGHSSSSQAESQDLVRKAPVCGQDLVHKAPVCGQDLVHKAPVCGRDQTDSGTALRVPLSVTETRSDVSAAPKAKENNPGQPKYTSVKTKNNPGQPKHTSVKQPKIIPLSSNMAQRVNADVVQRKSSESWSLTAERMVKLSVCVSVACSSEDSDVEQPLRPVRRKTKPKLKCQSKPASPGQASVSRRQAVCAESKHSVTETTPPPEPQVKTQESDVCESSPLPLAQRVRLRTVQ